MEMISGSSQGLLTYLMNQIAEEDIPDDELRLAAQFGGYRLVEELLAFIDGPEPKNGSWAQAMDQFIAGIDEKRR